MTTGKPLADVPQVTGRRPRRLGVAAWTAVVAVVALGSSLVSLLFDLRPDLRGDPRNQIGAELSVFAVDPNVTLGRTVEDAAGSPADLRRRLQAVCDGKLTCGRLSIPGERIYVRTTVEGFKSRTVSLRLALYDAASQTRVPGVSSPVGTETLNSPTAKSVIHVWVICPSDPTRRYFVRVELYDVDGTTLAVGDSPVFKPRC